MAGRHSYVNGMPMMQHLGRILEWIPQDEGQEDPCHISAVLLLVGSPWWEASHFGLVLHRDQSSNHHTGYPMAMRSFSQVLESNVLRKQYSFDDAIHTQKEPAFDFVLDRFAGAAPGSGPWAPRLLRWQLRRTWAGSGRWQPGEGTRRGPT